MASGNKKFGKRIKELREARKMTQEQLAEKVGLDYQSISRIETGVYFTNYENLNSIADAFCVPVRELFNYGHIKTNEELKSDIWEDINTLNDTQLRYVYKMLQHFKEYRNA